MSWLPHLAGNERLHKFNTREDRIRREDGLRRWTNFALLVAVVIGVVIALAHGGTVTASLAAFGAAIGLGAVLGFLFGVPGTGSSRTSVSITGPAQNPPVQVGGNSGQQNGNTSNTSDSTAAGAVPAQAQVGTTNVPVTSGAASGPAQTGSTDTATVSGTSGTVPAVPPPVSADTGSASGTSGTAPAQVQSASAGTNIAPTTAGTSPVQAQAGRGTGGATQGTSLTSAGPQSNSAGQVQPSNLEQVADWVTKLLLGGGLTQIQHIPPLVWQWARWAAIGMLTETDLKNMANPGASKSQVEQIILGHQAFAAGLLDYGFILGFFGGFLITKLQLGRAISSD